MYFSDLMFLSPGLYLCVSEKKGLTLKSNVHRENVGHEWIGCVLYTIKWGDGNITSPKRGYQPIFHCFCLSARDLRILRFVWGFIVVANSICPLKNVDRDHIGSRTGNSFERKLSLIMHVDACKAQNMVEEE